MYKKQFGKDGEDLAEKFLTQKGYEIVERNFLIRGGEIDIVSKIKGWLVFVEVKARKNINHGLPEEAITYWKIKSLKKTALFYTQKIGWGDKPYRFDLVAIDYTLGSPKIELFEDIIN